jgi:hypothetical protein
MTKDAQAKEKHTGESVEPWISHICLHLLACASQLAPLAQKGP